MFAKVQIGKLTCGGKASREHSKQEESRGIITLACPLNPSVPPSINGIISSASVGIPSSSTWTLFINKALIHRRGSMESSPAIIIVKSS